MARPKFKKGDVVRIGAVARWPHLEGFVGIVYMYDGAPRLPYCVTLIYPDEYKLAHYWFNADELAADLRDDEIVAHLLS